MEQEEKNKIISKELDSLMPDGLADQEKSVWRMCFNALRLADFATANPSDGEIIAMFATIQMLFAGHCTSMSGPILDAKKDIIVFIKQAETASTLAKSDNDELVRNFLEKIGSNFWLAARRLDFSYAKEWCVLSENPERTNLRWG